MTLDEALNTVAGLERYPADTQPEAELLKAGQALRDEIGRMRSVVQAHKTWETEAIAQAKNAILAYEQMRRKRDILQRQLDVMTKAETEGK